MTWFYSNRGIQLSFDPLDELIDASREGLRLWELFRLEHDSLLHYLHARHPKSGAMANHWNGKGDKDLLAAFERWLGDHLAVEHPEESSGAQASLLAIVLSEAEQRWPRVQDARAAASASTDALTRFELDLLAREDHPNDRMRRAYPRETQVYSSGWIRRTRALPDAILALAADVLRCPAITGMTHRGSGDWRLIRLACEEQARRCNGPPTTEENDFPVSVLSPWTGYNNDPYVEPDEYFPALSPYPAWSEGVRFQFEGFILHDFYIEDRNLLGGWDHSVVDRVPRIVRHPITREVTLQTAKLVLAGYDDPQRSDRRTWLHHASGWIAAVLPNCEGAAEVLAILEKHAFATESEPR